MRQALSALVLFMGLFTFAGANAETAVRSQINANYNLINVPPEAKVRWEKAIACYEEATATNATFMQRSELQKTQGQKAGTGEIYQTQSAPKFYYGAYQIDNGSEKFFAFTKNAVSIYDFGSTCIGKETYACKHQFNLRPPESDEKSIACVQLEIRNWGSYDHSFPFPTQSACGKMKDTQNTALVKPSNVASGQVIDLAYQMIYEYADNQAQAVAIELSQISLKTLKNTQNLHLKNLQSKCSGLETPKGWRSSNSIEARLATMNKILSGEANQGQSKPAQIPAAPAKAKD